MDERRDYIRKSLGSTVNVFDRNTNQYVGMVADFSDGGIMIASSVIPIQVGRKYEYILVTQSGNGSENERVPFDAESVWCERASASFYGTGFQIKEMSQSLREVLESCILTQQAS